MGMVELSSWELFAFTLALFAGCFCLLLLIWRNRSLVGEVKWYKWLNSANLKCTEDEQTRNWDLRNEIKKLKAEKSKLEQLSKEMKECNQRQFDILRRQDSLVKDFLYDFTNSERVEDQENE